MKQRQSPRAVPCGFTMIELLVVMAVLGILAAAVLPLGETLLVSQKERELRAALLEIRQALDEHRRLALRDSQVAASGASGYPATLQVLVDGIAVRQADGAQATARFLRRIPRDPFADPALPAEQTWRLRSYASPANRPAPGADVYDIHSSSDGVALDGTKYAAW